MRRIDGTPIVTAAQMRDAEVASGLGVAALMERAGTAIAHAVHRLGGGSAVLVLCGPGNNGGDGYIAARVLAAAGTSVRVAALGAPRTEAAKAARAGWPGPVEPLADARPAPILVDALFGTGLTRALDSPAAQAGEDVVETLHRLAHAAQLGIAIDLPSGVATDDGRAFSTPPVFDVTLALGAAKPAHLLQPAARHCGAVRILDIGIETSSDAQVLDAPNLPPPDPDAHKYTRGMVAVVAGDMPGASELAALAAMHAGAGYVTLFGDTRGPPHALVRAPLGDHAIADHRIGALVIGPGLGRGDHARSLLATALAARRPLVIDGDALRLLDPEPIAGLGVPVILTPHAGEFDALFGTFDTDKIARTRAAAARAGAVVVFKGADTVIAAPDGRVRVGGDASGWLSTAGTGDVLAGAIAAMLATGLAPLDAAAAGVWLHRDAARRLGAGFIADDLAIALREACAAS